ncbi:MAG: hypothetical protein ACPGXK_13120 [Phycisphaerae bacterium]
MNETIAKLERTSQAACNQICEKQTLELGIAYYSPAFPNSAQLNQYREVIAKDSDQYAAALKEANEWFGEQRLRCHGVAMADGSSPDALIAFLADDGYQCRQFAAMQLTSWGEISVSENVRILPARAMRPALRETFVEDERFVAEPAPLRADIVSERMDDAAYDMHVALVDGRPAGRCGLYQVGDIARVVELAALEGDHQAATLESLLGHSLALAKRLTMRTICMQVPVEDEMTLDLCRRAGFEQDGTLGEFERAVLADS